MSPAGIVPDRNVGETGVMLLIDAAETDRFAGPVVDRAVSEISPDSPSVQRSEPGEWDVDDVH
jgi:hypothetical protein